MPNTLIELVHFQLTKNCNLRCWFCGQWGRKGFFADTEGSEMTFADWKKVIEELKSYTEKPDIMLWGGEPLVYEQFEEIVKLLRQDGFRLGIVSNGVMINEYAALLKEEFCHIYVSVDGTKEIHDKIRGEGVFDKVKENLELLRGTNAKISVMSVLSEENISNLEDTVEEILKLNCDEIILQEMIALSKEEAEEYKVQMRQMGITTEYINSWIMENPPRCDSNAIEKLCRKYPDKVKHLPHGIGEPCKSENSHIHIAWNGNLLYCTDFYDFSAGNVKIEKIEDIFNNEKSEKFRRMIGDGKCPTCRHCSWRHSNSFRL